MSIQIGLSQIGLNKAGELFKNSLREFFTARPKTLFRVGSP
jgi:hypothetical protein